MKSIMYKYPIISSVVINIVILSISIYLVRHGIHIGSVLLIPAGRVTGHILYKGRNITELKKIIFSIFLILTYLYFYDISIYFFN